MVQLVSSGISCLLCRYWLIMKVGWCVMLMLFSVVCMQLLLLLMCMCVLMCMFIGFLGLLNCYLFLLWLQLQLMIWCCVSLCGWCGVLCVFRQVGEVQMGRLVLVSLWWISVELVSWVMWIVRLQFLLMMLMMWFERVMFSFIFGWCFRKIGYSGVRCRMLKVMGVLMCSRLVGLVLLVSSRLLVFFSVVIICLQCFRQRLLVLVSESCWVVCCIRCEFRCVFSFSIVCEMVVLEMFSVLVVLMKLLRLVMVMKYLILCSLFKLCFF